MAFFEEPTSDKIAPLSPAANDQRPVTPVKLASGPESTPRSPISPNPPPPPPSRLQGTSGATTTNADVSIDIARYTPPPPPPPRVLKSSKEIQQKPGNAVIALRSVAEPKVEPNDLSLSEYVDVFKNLSDSDKDNLKKILAPNMELSDFWSIFNQSSLFFTDLINRRPIDPSRQKDVYKLWELWSSAKKNSLISNVLSQLRFFRN